MKRRFHLSAAQRAAAQRAERLKRDLLREGLDLRGDPPVLSDGKGTPPEALAARYPELAARLLLEET